jgi:hypothetical protein
MIEPVPDAVESLVGEGREAFARGDGAGSRRAFEAALAERERGDLLEGLARALYLEGDYPGSMASHERAFAAYREEDDALGAARVARSVRARAGSRRARTPRRFPGSSQVRSRRCRACNETTSSGPTCAAARRSPCSAGWD